MALAPTAKEVAERECALAETILSIRPDWTALAVVLAIKADDRPWRTVVLAAINGAADPDIRHPNGLRYVNPTGKGAPTPTPPAFRRDVVLCAGGHGAESGLCAMCRAEGINR
jgi:hypothetical protein